MDCVTTLNIQFSPTGIFYQTNQVISGYLVL